MGNCWQEQQKESGGQENGSLFLERIATISMEDPPCHAARALLLKTSPIRS